MKVEARFTTHLDGRRYCHFWLIPSIEIDYEHFNTEKYGNHKWIHLTLSWLFWSLDVELIKEDEK